MPRLPFKALWMLAGGVLLLTAVPHAGGAQAGADDPPTPLAQAPRIALPEPVPTRTVDDVLASGVVITISLASQQMHVFRDGVLWRSSPVSTGKRGKETPAGVFAILQKKTFHRSNLYSNAPMPFMQRLTWDGIAIHAGDLPGYPASHGCIRLPKAFAAELFKVTNAASTAVIVVAEPVKTGGEALALARAAQTTIPIPAALLRREAAALAKADAQPSVRLPAARIITGPAPEELLPPQLVPPPPLAQEMPTTSQTIQLAAERSPDLAANRWAELSARRPELKAMQMAVIPATVNGTRYFRLRASSADAHTTCAALRRAGIDCFAVS